MTIGEERLNWLLTQFTSPDHEVRADAAEAVDQWADHISAAEGDAVGAVLVRLAADEREQDTLESLTHALDVLAQFDLVSQEVLQAAAELPIPPDDPSVAKYLTYLRARASGADVAGNFTSDEHRLGRQDS